MSAGVVELSGPRPPVSTPPLISGKRGCAPGAGPPIAPQGAHRSQGRGRRFHHSSGHDPPLRPLQRTPFGPPNGPRRTAPALVAACSGGRSHAVRPTAQAYGPPPFVVAALRPGIPQTRRPAEGGERDPCRSVAAVFGDHPHARRSTALPRGPPSRPRRCFTHPDCEIPAVDGQARGTAQLVAPFSPLPIPRAPESRPPLSEPGPHVRQEQRHDRGSGHGLRTAVGSER